MSSALADSALTQSDALAPLAERLRAANINPRTGLATDYLNHFNEVTMLLELVPDMPDVAEEVLAWSPIGYKKHFELSGFREKQLVEDAYDLAPAFYRNALEETVARMNERVRTAQTVLANLDPNEAAEDIRCIVGHIRDLTAQAGAIINGSLAPVSTSQGETAQDAVDALFD